MSTDLFSAVRRAGIRCLLQLGLGVVLASRVFAGAAANDAFSGRITIPNTVSSQSIAGSNVDATAEFGEPAFLNRGSSVWWTWTAPTNGAVVIDTIESSFDTVLGVYTGSSVDGLSEVAVDDDGAGVGLASRVEFNVVGGTAYHIAVDGFNGASGSIIIHFSGPADTGGMGSSVPILYAVGLNSSGQLGDGTTTDRSMPFLAASNVVFIAAGGGHSLFIKNDGTLWGMGDNFFGQLGDDASYYHSTPVQIANGVTAVAAGYDFSLFIKSDGTLWGMGNGWYGQLGDQATYTYQPIPVQIAGGVTAVAAGVHTSLFVKNDGTLWGMGYNGTGQLGDGTYTDRHTPVLIAANVTTVSAGEGHSLFVKNDGTLWGMGYNGAGQLGDGTLDNRSTPFLTASNVTALAAGGYHSLFVKSDETLWGMGYNGIGQLGDAANYYQYTPIHIATGVTAVAAGDLHSLFVKTDGTAWAMGDNEYGQLGDGTFVNRSTPVQIASGVTAVAAGSSHSLYIQSDLTILQLPQNQSVATNSTVTFTVNAIGSGPLTYQWRFNGTNIADATNASHTITNVQASDMGRYDVLITCATGTFASETFTLTITSSEALLAVALNATNLVWTTGGSSFDSLADWFAQTNITHDGVAAVRSGRIHATYPESWLSTVVTGPGMLTFWERVVANSDYSVLEFYIDGVLVHNFQSWGAWEQQTFYLDSGTLQLLWKFVYYGNSLSVIDQAELDEVNFVPGAVAPELSSIGLSRKYLYAGEGTYAYVDFQGTDLTYQWLRNGQNLLGQTNSIIYIENAQPTDAGVYSVVVTNSAGSVTQQVVTLTFVNMVSTSDLNTATDTPSFDWKTGDYFPWALQTTNTHDGVDAAQNGAALPYSEESRMETTVTGPGTLTFWCKVATDGNYLRFDIDGAEQFSLSGSRNWEQRTFNLTSGAHTLRWRFLKYHYLNPDLDLDRVWVDEVAFVPSSGIPAFTSITSQTLSSAGQFGFTLTDATGRTVVIEASTNLVDWVPVQTNVVGSGSISFSDPGAASTAQRFYRVLSQ